MTERTVRWEDARDEALAAMSPEQRAEYDAAASVADAELQRLDRLYPSRVTQADLVAVSGLLAELAEVYEGEDATPEQIRAVASWIDREVIRRDRRRGRRN